MCLTESVLIFGSNFMEFHQIFLKTVHIIVELSPFLLSDYVGGVGLGERPQTQELRVDEQDHAQVHSSFSSKSILQHSPFLTFKSGLFLQLHQPLFGFQFDSLLVLHQPQQKPPLVLSSLYNSQEILSLFSLISIVPFPRKLQIPQLQFVLIPGSCQVKASFRFEG